MKRKCNKKRFLSLGSLISFSMVITVSQFVDASKDSLYMYKHMYMGMYLLNMTGSMLCTYFVHCCLQKGEFWAIPLLVSHRPCSVLRWGVSWVVYTFFFLIFPIQTSMPGHGTSKRKNAPWGPTLKLLTAAGMTDPRTLSFHLWITACRVCWGRGWISLRISTIPMSSGWRERCFHSPSVGRSCSRITDWALVNRHLIGGGWLQ